MLETTGRCDDMAAFGAHREVLIVGRLNPMRAGVRTRSALAAALVMTVCLAIAGGVLLQNMWPTLTNILRSHSQPQSFGTKVLLLLLLL